MKRKIYVFLLAFVIFPPCQIYSVPPDCGGGFLCCEDPPDCYFVSRAVCTGDSTQWVCEWTPCPDPECSGGGGGGGSICVILIGCWPWLY